MDAHFHEYMGAVAGMQDLYGEPTLEHTDFHAEAGGECPLTAATQAGEQTVEPAGEQTVEPAVVAEVRETVAAVDAAVFAKAV